MTLFIVLIFLLLFAATMLAVTTALRVAEQQRKRKVQHILHTASGATQPLPETPLLNEAAVAKQPGLLTGLSELPVLRQVQAKIHQAGMDWPVAKLLVFMAVGAVAGMLLGSLVRVPLIREFASAGLALFLGALPYLVVMRKRRKRLREFEAEFPEALDFLARSLRAGHAFSMGLEMLADESPDPVGIEFRRLFNEHNLGAPLDVALRNLAIRVPLIDVKFFVSAISLQRETGGNLAEILTKLAYVIRERFRLKGQIRAISAHGRITTAVLTALPIVTAVGLSIVTPDYLPIMVKDPVGRIMIVGSIMGQITGYLVMKRIVNIKV